MLGEVAYKMQQQKQEPRCATDKGEGPHSRLCHTSPWAAAAIVAAAACSTYSSALGAGLVYDDRAAVLGNRDTRPTTPIGNLFYNDFWGTPLHKEQSHKSYRPLTVLTFRLNFAIHGLEPFGYHLVNVLLHCLVCLLYHRTCHRILPSSTSFIAALLFAVHPIHTEAVTSVVGRAELLSALFFLSALLFYIHKRSSHPTAIARAQWSWCLVTVALATAAMLCKEQGVTVLAVCCVYELVSCKPSHRAWKLPMFARPSRDVICNTAAFGLSAIALSTWRLRLNRMHLPAFSRFDNPASVASSPARQLTYNYLVTVNTWLLIFPSELCCDWTMGTVPLVTSFTDSRNFFTVAVYFVLALACRAVQRVEEAVRVPLILALSILVISYVPASNLLFPVGFVVAERVLYLPSMGYCLIVALGFTRLCEKRQSAHLIRLGFVVLLVSHVAKAVIRNYDWWSEQSLYRAALSVNPNNAKMLVNMGQALETFNLHHDAYMHYREAVEVQPDYIRGHLNLGRALVSLKRFQEAERVFLHALSLLPSPGTGGARQAQVTPNHLQVYLSLASLISKNSSRLKEADQLYKQAISLRSDFTSAYLNRGEFLLRTNRTKEAEGMYERAVELDDTNPDLNYNLGVILMDQGRSEEAMTFFNRALELDPDHKNALTNSAALLYESGTASQRNMALERLERVVHSGKQDERAYFHLAMLALEKKDVLAAEKWFRKAVVVQPNLRSALFNLALLLTEQQRPMEAMRFLKQLLKHHPDHIEGLVLLGEINISYLKDLSAAEKCYQKILALNPRHVQGFHNLCVVYVERGELNRAEHCFRHVSALDPSSDYIQRHLAITQDLLRNRSAIPGDVHDTRIPSALQDFATSPASR